MYRVLCAFISIEFCAAIGHSRSTGFSQTYAVSNHSLGLQGLQAVKPESTGMSQCLALPPRSKRAESGFLVRETPSVGVEVLEVQEVVDNINPERPSMHPVNTGRS